MSNLSQSKTSFNLKTICGQKKRKQTIEMSSRPLDNVIVELIVSRLPLNRKLDLMSVNKQFKKCIEHNLAKEESIKFVNTYGKDLDVFVDNHNQNQIELNKIGHNFDDNNHCLVQLLSKFKQIRRLEFDNNIRINNRMIEWILKRFPELSSLSLLDYRCNYLTIDWMTIGDKVSQNLVSLEIECRLNQQILEQTLADLVAKLNRLEELTIVSPRRRLRKVFAAFGPNVVKLCITYCLGLYYDEVMALINGNGRQLQELDIQYQTYGFGIDQNQEFALICNNLTNLKSFTFNHSTLHMEALAFISNLKHLQTFRYNFRGYYPFQINRNVPQILHYGYKNFDFRSIMESVPTLQSLSLYNIELRPQIMYKWTQLFPNLKHLYLKCLFLCGCQSRSGPKCGNCLRLCFQSLSELKFLRSLDFGESIVLPNLQYLRELQQIEFLRINCYLLEDSNYLFNVFNTLIKMAKHRRGRPIFVTLYELNLCLISGIQWTTELPPNLKITFEVTSN